MAIFFRCSVCNGEHQHPVTLTKQTFDSLQATPQVTWLHAWSRCPQQAQVVEVRSQHLIWKEAPVET